MAGGPAPPGLHYDEWAEVSDRTADPNARELTLVNYFLSRASYTNLIGDPSGLRGVSLGPIGQPEGAGSSVSVGEDTANVLVEQRWIPVITYAPDFADGMAAFRAQFEVDYAWGIAANTLQNNQGGGLNADQVNMQTKNVNVAIYPTKRPGELSILLGTQSIYDSIYDPTITSLFDIVETGYKLAFYGTDATGISLFANTKYGRAKASAVPIGAAQPDKAEEGDARFSYVWLATLDYALEVQPSTVVGLSYWRLQDNGKGSAFAYEGLVKSGPTSGALSSYTGTAALPIEQATGHVNYLGANFHHNLRFHTSDLAASGFVMWNFGRFDSHVGDTELQPSIEVNGLAANLELDWKWGRTRRDVVTLEGMFTTGDGNPTDERYTSAFTLNYYGLPGAVWFDHQTILLFPFTQTVSNYSGAVTDISNQGLGLAAAILSGRWDMVPNKLDLKLGTAAASSSVRPAPNEDNFRRGKLIGVEFNAELRYHLRYLMTVGLHGGYLMRGDFYARNERVSTDPWAAFTTFTWYAF